VIYRTRAAQDGTDRRRLPPIAWRPGPGGRVCSLACELQRDWARQDTVAAIAEIVLTGRLLKE
jgi:hypothetical protein